MGIPLRYLGIWTGPGSSVVEHVLGKYGVVSSILTSGSMDCRCVKRINRRVLRADVAQW